MSTGKSTVSRNTKTGKMTESRYEGFTCNVFYIHQVRMLGKYEFGQLYLGTRKNITEQKWEIIVSENSADKSVAIDKERLKKFTEHFSNCIMVLVTPLDRADLFLDR